MELIRREEGEGDDKIEFYTVVLTGQSGMSQSGLAVLAGVDQSTLSRLETTLMHSAPSETLKPFQGKSLTLMIDNPKIEGKPVGNLKIYKSSYCAAVLKHYAEQGRQIAVFSLIKFAEKGIDSWIQEITGWKQWQEKIQPYTDVYIKRIENMRDHKISDDLWMIFREAAELLLLIEKDWQVPINQYDILDGSIGRLWSDYRKPYPWAGTVGSYNHKFRDKRGEQPCAAYEMTELPYFRKWLREVYIPTHLPQYLVNKYGKSVTRLIYTENGLLTDVILQLTEIKR
ncbi:helix-turn-helix domain-containing protein, partial [Leptolyngbya sp. GGD]|uniref:helix-turn-helix domain-containing protein n=1 Tax=Leptolyngbya sp. GGD TaxID=2997907 RepID=UPI00227CF516